MNSRFVVAALLVACASCSFIPLRAVSENLRTKVLSPVTYLRSAVGDEETHFCGYYGSGCIDASIMGMEMSYVVEGPMDADPTVLYMAVQSFADTTCSSQMEFLSLNASFSLVPVNDVEKSFNATATNAYFKATELFVQGMTCSTPLVVGQYYSVLDVNCTDAEGQDPFADSVQGIGNSTILILSRNSTGLSIGDEESEMQYLPYVSDMGCSSTTVTPTVPPTSSPAPTTVTPTVPPTSSPTPTTPAPTSSPAPTTITPTVHPTTSPIPTTSPVPPTSTPSPTEKPTPQPTEKPTKAPSNNMLIYIIIGVVVLVIVVIVIICCCKKSSSNKNSRVHRVEYKTVESVPLKKNYTELMSLISLYSRSLASHPLLTKTVTSLIIGGAGDIVAQKIVSKSNHFEVDWKRTFRMGFVCMCYGGINHYWYRFLECKVTFTGMKKVLTKMFFDQLFFIPVFDGLMFFGLSCLENIKNQPEAGIQKVKLCLWPALRANYCVWPLLQIINFRYVPLNYQVLFTTTGVFFWNIFLSDVAHRRGKTTATHNSTSHISLQQTEK